MSRYKNYGSGLSNDGICIIMGLVLLVLSLPALIICKLLGLVRED